MQTYTIDRLGHQGDGVALPGPTFIPRSLPGEDVAWDGSALRILTPSSDRIAPPCQHAKRCGGCSVQHAADPFVAQWKSEIVTTALAARGLSGSVRTVHTSPVQSRRRATFSARRTKSGVQIGFHASRSEELIPIVACQVITSTLQAALIQLEPIVRCAASRKSEIKLVVTETDSGLDVDVQGGKAIAPHDVGGLLFEGLARLSQDGEPLATPVTPRLMMGRAAVPVPPATFLQATRSGEASLRAGVAEAVGTADRIADLFSGCGTFALPLAQVADVHAVEADQTMLDALQSGARATPDLHQVSVEARDLFRRPHLAAELNKFEAVVLDPPRAGAQAQTVEVARSEIARVAMVSCNPVSFARDAAQLVASGFEMTFLDVVDQFRWSAHVELVAGFLRR